MPIFKKVFAAFLAVFVISTAAFSAPAAKVVAFYVPWDQDSFNSLKNNIYKIDIVIPVWILLIDNSGNIKIEDEKSPQRVADLISQSGASTQVMPLVNNYNGITQKWDSGRIKAILGNPAARKHLVKNLFNFVKKYNLDGINVDFEEVPAQSQAHLPLFMKELYTAFHKAGLKVTQDVPFYDSPFNYKSLARYNDYLILMAYDEHWNTSAAGPIASKQWFSSNLKKRLKGLDPRKTIVGLGNYGYDWPAKTKNGKSLTYREINTLIKKYKTTVRTDKISGNPTFDYSDNNGQRHYVWFLNSNTAEMQVKAALPYNVAGFALWRLGSESPALWSIF